VLPNDSIGSITVTSTNLPLIELRNVSKSYGGVHAVRDLSFNVSPGEIHAICGENGAGKSTLIRLLAGITVPDHGEIFIQNQRLALGIVKASESAGIAVMHQESTAFPDLNAIDNIFVGREITRLAGWILDRSEMKQQTRKLLERIGEQVPLNVPIGSLPLAQRQMVALARALSHDCRLLIMDEPTASLSYRETQVLLQIVRQLREQGVSVLYVSHRLEEIFSIADRVTVLRDGQLVGTRFVRDVDSSELIRMMVGRDIEVVSRMGTPARPLQNKVLEVDHLTKTGIFDDISFTVHSGEILGLTGLVGAGRSEIVRAIFGIDRYDSGNVRVLGKSLTCGSVKNAMMAGLAMVPEDRQHEGLVLPMSVGSNISLAILSRLSRFGFIQRTHEQQQIAEQMTSLLVKAAGPGIAANTLSGGNQQKLVLGKWLASRPKVLILDEPTRGVDVGAKAQFHQLIRNLAESGMATLVISSDLPELLGLCHRLVVIREGSVAGRFECDQTTQEEVLSLSLPESQGVETR